MSIVAGVRRLQRRRQALVVALLVAVILVLFALSLILGAYTVSVPDLLATLVGHGQGRDNFIVLTLRLPRATLAVLVGIAFGLAGALFQSLLGNVLASPDVIGISGGASAAAVFALLVLGLGGPGVSLAAFLGALGVAALIYGLSWRAGLTGYRFVLIGVAISFFVKAVLGYLLTRSDMRDAQSALVWLVGSLGSAQWADIAALATALALLLPALAILVPRLRVLQLGDASATGLGLPVQRTRLILLVVAVALAAVGTAAAGPVAFVAFVAAPIARRLVGTGGLAFAPSALVGVVVVLGSDIVGQHFLPGGMQVPVGIITGAIGAPYLLWLLARANRSGGVL